MHPNTASIQFPLLVLLDRFFLVLQQIYLLFLSLRHFGFQLAENNTFKPELRSDFRNFIWQWGHIFLLVQSAVFFTCSNHAANLDLSSALL